MKQVLSLLMAFVFLQTQSWALSGGPGGSGTVAGGSLSGTYAGVLVPQVAIVGGSASIGLFTLVQPDSGLTTGTISVFVNGTGFTGTVSGVMDPKDGSFDGVIDAVSTFTVSILVQTNPPTLQSFAIRAQGSMQAEVAPDNTPSIFTPITTAPSRIAGTASLDIFFQIAANGTPIITQTALFDVDGFKQDD